MSISDLIRHPWAYGLDTDSDEVEAKLTELGINPAQCTVEQAITALTALAIAHPPRPHGAQPGNTNAKRDDPRTRKIMVRLTNDEHSVIIAAAGDNPISKWVRDVALSAATRPPFPIRIDETLPDDTIIVAAPDGITLTNFK